MEKQAIRLGKAETWGGLIWLAFGLWVAWQGYTMGLGELQEPGSGFAVFWAGVIASGLALTVVAGAASTEGGPSVASLWAGTRWQKVMLVMVLLLVFGFFFERIGFIPCSLALLLVLMRFVDPVPWWQAVSVAFGSVLGVWYVIVKLLKIQLPAGLLSPWLG